ncbi:MAG: hypothetical protein JOY80_07120, partial [Candidatus Dormibacteraeota bacterium]|nr:hypothetical protein [Candidatus Dormibacteraeota bacterium]
MDAARARVAAGFGIVAVVVFGVLLSARPAGADTFANGDCVDYLNTLVGNLPNTTIDGSRDITDNGDSVTLSDCTLTGDANGASGTDGVLTINSGSLTLHHVSITDLSGSSSPISNYGTLTIDQGSTISDNVSVDGGAIYDEGTSLQLDHVKLDGNQSTNGSGGAIDVEAGTAAITGGEIKDNTATGGGGAIYNGGSAVTLTGVTVSKNTSGGPGGAIDNEFGILTIDTSTADPTSVISDNTAQTSGGAVEDFQGCQCGATTEQKHAQATRRSLHASTTMDSVTISNSTLNGNTSTAGDGGALSSSFGTVSLSNDVISDNTANSNGGGVQFSDATATISGTTVSGNETQEGNGGGMELETSTVTVNGSSVFDSGDQTQLAAENGGAIENASNSTLCLSGVTIGGAKPTDGNRAAGNGGGLDNENESFVAGPSDCTSTPTVSPASDVTIENNTTGQDGGGIYNNWSLTLAGSSVDDNVANGDNNNYRFRGNGGGLADEFGGVASLTQTTVDGNTSSGDGGGIFNKNCSELGLSAVSVSYNTSQGDSAGDLGNGGGIANERASAVGGTLPLSCGGDDAHPRAALRMTEPASGATVPMDDSVVVSGNSAQSSGGGIFNGDLYGDESTLDMSRADISDNKVTGDCECSGNGGGIDNESSTLGLDSVTLDTNKAAGNGGAIENDGSNASLTGPPGADTNGAGDAPNLTIAANHAGTPGALIDIINSGFDGAAIDNEDGGFVGLVNATIAGNFVDQPAQPASALSTLNDSAANTEIGNSIVADNQPANCSAAVQMSDGRPRGTAARSATTTSVLTDEGYNIDSGTTCDFASPGQSDVSDASLDLLALGQHGGPTVGTSTDATQIPTQPLGPASIAQGFVTGGCPPPSTDARGLTRAGNGCSAGATEGDVAVTFSPSSFDGITDVTVTVSVNVSPPCPGDPVQLTWNGAPWGPEVTLHASGNSCVAVIDPVPPTTTPGNYRVAATDQACSCVGQTSVTLNPLPGTGTPPTAANIPTTTSGSTSGGGTSGGTPQPSPTPTPAGGALGTTAPPLTAAPSPSPAPSQSSPSSGPSLGAPTPIWGLSLSVPATLASATVQTAVVLAAVLLLLVLIPFPAELFNATYDENQARIKRWWAIHLAWLVAVYEFFKDEEGKRGRAVSLVLVVILGGVLGAGLDPAFGWNLHTVSLSGSVALA